MEQGSLPERYLKRSVIKHIRKQDKNARLTAAVGADFSVQGDVVTADGMGESPFCAWVKAENNFSCSGGSATGARLFLLLPADIKESKIKTYMAEFNALAEAENIQILGGHTQVSDGVKRPQFYVTMLGTAGRFFPQKKEVKPDCDIVFCGYAGYTGTDRLLREHGEALRGRFSETYLKGAYAERETYRVRRAAELLTHMEETRIFYLHDVSGGGLYGALWQTGVYLDKGFRVRHEAIPIRQETIEICEFFNINPYLLESCGGLLAVAQDGERAVNALKKQGVCASVIGKVTESREKLIVVGDADVRCLSPVNGDEIFHV